MTSNHLKDIQTFQRHPDMSKTSGQTFQRHPRHLTKWRPLYKQNFWLVTSTACMTRPGIPVHIHSAYVTVLNKSAVALYSQTLASTQASEWHRFFPAPPICGCRLSESFAGVNTSTDFGPQAKSPLEQPATCTDKLFSEGSRARIIIVRRYVRWSSWHSVVFGDVPPLVCLVFWGLVLGFSGKFCWSVAIKLPGSELVWSRLVLSVRFFISFVRAYTISRTFV
jgi:hypothetical protein